MGNILSVRSAGALLGGSVIFGNADFIAICANNDCLSCVEGNCFWCGRGAFTCVPNEASCPSPSSIVIPPGKGKFCPSPAPTTDIPRTSPSSSSFYYYFFWGFVGCVAVLAVGVVTAFVKARNRRLPFQRLEVLPFAALEEAVEMNRITITRGNRYGSVDAMEDVGVTDEIVHFQRSGVELDMMTA